MGFFDKLRAVLTGEVRELGGKRPINDLKFRTIGNGNPEDSLYKTLTSDKEPNFDEIIQKAGAEIGDVLISTKKNKEKNFIENSVSKNFKYEIGKAKIELDRKYENDMFGHSFFGSVSYLFGGNGLGDEKTLEKINVKVSLGVEEIYEIRYEFPDFYIICLGDKPVISKRNNVVSFDQNNINLFLEQGYSFFQQLIESSKKLKNFKMKVSNK